MKMDLRRTIAAMMAKTFLGLGLALLVPAALLAATLTVTPSSVSNGYSGDLVVSITGLTNLEPIFLDKYLDANGDGTVNAGEPLLQRFRITEGSASTIGGATNLNRPGDTDGLANGQISARLNFAAASEFNRVAGQYRFRLSSPSGRFSPVEQAFSVTQTPFAQMIVGTAYTNNTPLTNGVVTLQNLWSGEFAAGVVASNNGGFSLRAPAGAYRVVAFKPGGSVAPQTSAPVVYLGPGETKTANVTNAAAPMTVSGYVQDDTSLAALSGVQILLASSNGLTTVAFTDTNGYYSAPVTASGAWSLQPSDASLSQIGYLAVLSNAVANTLTASVVTNLRLPSATSLIYGALRDEASQPVAGAALSASNTLAVFAYGRGFSAANGAYAIGVKAGLEWYIQPEIDRLGRLGYVGLATNVSLTNGQALPTDLPVHSQNAHILGRLTRNDAAPLPGLTIEAFSYETPFFARAYSDTNGNYDLGVFGGDWFITFNPSDLQKSNVISPVLSSLSLTDGASTNGFNVTLCRTSGAITGYVHSTTGGAIAGVPVYAESGLGGFSYVLQGVTDTAGNYSLSAFSNAWTVSVGDLGAWGYETPASQPTTVSNVTNTVNFTAASRGPLHITTLSLPYGLVGTNYLYSLQATGGALPYTWVISAGSLTDLSLDADGTISGMPLSAGTDTLTIQVTDNLGASTTQVYSLMITIPSWLAIWSPGSGVVQVDLTGKPGQTYVLEALTDIAQTTWTPVATNVALGGATSFTNLSAALPAKFYRAREQ